MVNYQRVQVEINDIVSDTFYLFDNGWYSVTPYMFCEKISQESLLRKLERALLYKEQEDPKGFNKVEITAFTV